MQTCSDDDEVDVNDQPEVCDDYRTDIVMNLSEESSQRDLYLAALGGNWENAERIIKQNPGALTTKINAMLSMTALHVAAFSGHSEFVEKLVEIMSPDEVALQDFTGNTALHLAATAGSVNVAMALLRKNPALTGFQGNQGFIPLLSAVVYGAEKGKEMAWFLARRTRKPFVKTTTEDHLLLELTHAGFHDITLYLLRRYPFLATYTEEKSGRNILNILAVRPTDFLSGTRLNFWEKWIYKSAPCKPSRSMRGDIEDPWGTKVGKWFREQTWKVVMTVAPSTGKKLQDAKLRHKYALELVNFVCKRAKRMPNRKIIKFFVKSEILNLATSSGIVEIVKVCLQHFPDLIWFRKNWDTVLHVAIAHRRELIFNLIYERSALCKLFVQVGDKKELIVESTETQDSETENNQILPKTTMMHLAAKLAPSPQLSSISGTALQMQRELLWFKEVEKLAHPSDKEKKDDNGYTPRELFTEQHKGLVDKAEKWMKDTSTSCMVVTTLVATVVFAAAFTVPGGNNSNGFPIFLGNKPFTVFMISDALALFSALTSVLMFLSILTARYAEEDFLIKLPLKLLIGLASLLSHYVDSFCCSSLDRIP